MQGEERKQQILQAAIKSFSAYGYERTSIAIICEDAKIARGTLYQYFKNKSSLFREIVESYSKRIQAYMQPMDLSRDDCPPPAEFLYNRYYMIFNEVNNNKDVYSILLREALNKSAETEDVVIETYKSFVDLIQAEVAIGIRAGIYQPVDAEFVGVWTYHGIRGIMEHYLIDQNNSTSLDILAEMATQMSVAFLLYSGQKHKKPKESPKNH